jgi:hypothetical protein
MNAETSTARSETRHGYWRRVMRPLFWWLLLALALFAIHQHQLAMERTRIYFSVTMYETNALDDAVAILDGHRVGNGDKIQLGPHCFTITQPKAEPFSTNFYAWYGRHDFGKINLKRAMGTLNVTAEPAARVISISAPEFSLTLNDSGGTNLLVPTDTYHITAGFARCSAAQDCQVTTGNTTPCLFAPQLGAISVTCNELPTAFELQDLNGNMFEQGDVPAVITELPSGQYFVLVEYHNHLLKQGAVVMANETNDVPFRFAFGATRLESVPAGASVYTTNGVYLGTTPLILAELPPSTNDYRMQLRGYEAAKVSVVVAEGQTNIASVVLTNFPSLGSQATKQGVAVGSNHDAEQASVEKPQAERLNGPRDYFAKLMSETPNSGDFAEQDVTANGDVAILRTKIADALSKSLLLKFTIEQNEEPVAGVFLIRAKLSMLDGFRRCYIVGGQAADGEVTIQFKVMEYTWPSNLTLGALISRPGDDKAILIDQSNLSRSLRESRRRLGIKIVRERIQAVIRQPAAK